MAMNMLLRYTSQKLFREQPCTCLVNYVQARGAARKGKRIQRAREARLRASARRLQEAQNPKPKKVFGQSNTKVDRSLLRFMDERQLDATLPDTPEDDVYFVESFKKKRLSLDEILDLHRQVAHPDVLNKPDALVAASIELSIKTKIKKKKLIEKVDILVSYPHDFKHDVKAKRLTALSTGEYGVIDYNFGRLNMENRLLRENLSMLLKNLSRFNLGNEEDFLQRVLISTSASKEIFPLKHWELKEEDQDKSGEGEEVQKAQ